MDAEARILAYLKSVKSGYSSVERIASGAKLNSAEKRSLKRILNKLCNDGKAVLMPRLGYCDVNTVNCFQASVRGGDGGFAFLLRDGGGDYYVPQQHLNGALDGDTVLGLPIKGTTDRAAVLKILKRAHEQFVGTLSLSREQATVYPDNKRLPPVAVPKALVMGKNGDKVVCLITSYKPRGLSVGKILEVLGESGDLESEELSIIRDYGLEDEFPPEAISDAKIAASEKIELIKTRCDLRQLTVITIDGEDTRDIDDGVSLLRDGDTFVLGVHIADVSHYVKPTTELDKNAYARGTSVYFPDKVLPMLPPALSNGACSLNENEDRYAVSCIMTFSSDGERLSYEIKESIIRSKHRTTYTEITSLLQKDPDICIKYRDILKIAEDMQTLCLALEKRREKRGAVNLDIKEAHITIDSDGNIVIPVSERNVAQRIIEQFMVAANEAVAEFLTENGASCMYRVHERPTIEKCVRLQEIARLFCENADFNPENVEPADFSKLVLRTANKPHFNVLNKIMLRTMQKARYSEQNLKHFGLASDCYCHFTSPIRRYPDLMVHRSVKAVLRGYPNLKNDFFKAAGAHLSLREKVSEECERKVDDLYAVAYMSERIGEKFDAVVSGITANNVYCELENGIEGVIPVDDLPDDRYYFDDTSLTLRGRKNSFRLGDKVKIEVSDYDLSILKTLFVLIN